MTFGRPHYTELDYVLVDPINSLDVGGTGRERGMSFVWVVWMSYIETTACSPIISCIPLE